MKRFLIVGLGPIGGILAAHLESSGQECYGVDIWDEHRNAIDEHGITVSGQEEFHHNITKTAKSITELKDIRFDYVIISVKTPVMPKVVEEIKTLKGNFMVASFQNGIDNEEFLKEHFDFKRVMRGSLNYAGGVVSPGHLAMVFFHKPNYIGCFCTEGKVCGHAKEIADLMTRSGLDTEATDTIKLYTWKKAILNAGLSALTSILGWTMQQAMTNEESLKLVEEVLIESIAVAKADGYTFGDDFLEVCMKYLGTAGPHKPSMLVDIENGERTEIGYINGRIASLGRDYGVPVPVNTIFTTLVRARELDCLKKS
jgi:2-dehydropantoate 2-reductase